MPFTEALEHVYHFFDYKTVWILTSCCCIVFQTVFFMLKNIPKVNPGSLITGILCLIIILVLKHINEKYKQKLKFPIPAELIVVSLLPIN